MVENIELTSLLEPQLFENHRDIINALFQVYFEIGEEYLHQFWDEKQANIIKEIAKNKVEKKYGIGKYNATNQETEKELAAM